MKISFELWRYLPSLQTFLHRRIRLHTTFSKWQNPANHSALMVAVRAFDSMAPSTPSPPVTALSMNGSATSNSTSRRPPRKSTLTQQQKNQKRQRATQDQLITLEVEFNKNPTPTAAVRERIAQDISMTERSVQIWFQNRSGLPCGLQAGCR